MSTNGNGFQDEEVYRTQDEDGVEHVFKLFDRIEVEGQVYALLVYMGEPEEAESDEEGYDEEVVVMKIVEENGEFVFEEIEDEAEFEKVVAYIEEHPFEEDEDEEDDEEEESEDDETVESDSDDDSTPAYENN